MALIPLACVFTVLRALPGAHPILIKEHRPMSSCCHMGSLGEASEASASAGALKKGGKGNRGKGLKVAGSSAAASSAASDGVPPLTNPHNYVQV